MVLKGEKNIGYSFYNFLGIGDRSDICKPKQAVLPMFLFWIMEK